MGSSSRPLQPTLWADPLRNPERGEVSSLRVVYLLVRTRWEEERVRRGGQPRRVRVKIEKFRIQRNLLLLLLRDRQLKRMYHLTLSLNLLHSLQNLKLKHLRELQLQRSSQKKWHLPLPLLLQSNPPLPILSLNPSSLPTSLNLPSPPPLLHLPRQPPSLSNRNLLLHLPLPTLVPLLPFPSQHLALLLLLFLLLSLSSSRLLFP